MDCPSTERTILMTGLAAFYRTSLPMAYRNLPFGRPTQKPTPEQQRLVLSLSLPNMEQTIGMVTHRFTSVRRRSTPVFPLKIRQRYVHCKGVSTILSSRFRDRITSAP